ncbi:MAG: hypothetical protein ACRD0U_08840, partial [Acidimicrobiales bacterium]
VGLALNADRGDPALWPVFLFTAAAAGVLAVDGPTRTAAVLSLVRRRPDRGRPGPTGCGAGCGRSTLPS